MTDTYEKLRSIAYNAGRVSKYLFIGAGIASLLTGEGETALGSSLWAANAFFLQYATKPQTSQEEHPHPLDVPQEPLSSIIRSRARYDQFRYFPEEGTRRHQKPADRMGTIGQRYLV